MSILQKLFSSGPVFDLKTIIQQGALLVDVRTAAEFRDHPVKGSVNIPLDKVETQMKKYKKTDTIIVFCRSGSRSAQAKAILDRLGFQNVINGRSFVTVGQFV